MYMQRSLGLPVQITPRWCARHRNNELGRLVCGCVEEEEQDNILALRQRKPAAAASGSPFLLMHIGRIETGARRTLLRRPTEGDAGNGNNLFR